MEKEARKIYDKFDTKRKTYDAQLADQQDLEELKALESKIKNSDKSV